jgi:hypothetical protein
MKIEEGKFYRTRDGRKVGPMTYNLKESIFPWMCESSRQTFRKDGYFCLSGDHELDLVAEWTEEPAAPKLWRDMTPEEKGALLLAHHEGKVVECWNSGKWEPKGHGGWGKENAYRIRPEPKRDRVVMAGTYTKGMGWVFCSTHPQGPTHRITFDVIDGEPDCASVKMERI